MVEPPPTDAAWDLYDHTGLIRAEIPTPEALGLLLSNMQHEQGSVVCHLTTNTVTFNGDPISLRVDIRDTSDEE
jgi:hypothetical protein